MDITSFISTKRQALLIADHTAYRSQLSRQILALRKRLGRTTPKREKFSKKPITATDVKSNHEFLHLLLLLSERSWAHALAMKATHEGGLKGSTRKEVLSKLVKSTRNAEEVVKLVKEIGAETKDMLEARAYAACMRGSEAFERQTGGEKKEGQEGKTSWEGCVKAWSEARVVYAALLAKEGKGVYRDLLGDTVDPTLRYAAYQAGLSRSVAVNTVARKYFPKEDGELVTAVESVDQWAFKDKPVAETNGDTKMEDVVEAPSSVQWRGRKANIVDSAIGQALASVATAEARLRSYLAEHPSASSRDKAAAYDDVLIASQDAADAAKHATDELEKERVDEGDSRMQDLRVTSLAVNYDLVSWRVGRNRVLIGDRDGLDFPAHIQKQSKRTRKDGTPYPVQPEPRSRKLARLRERVVLYDATIQSIESVKDLRGAMRDETFVAELDAKSAYFRALKCVNIATSHSLLGNHLNALALLKRAHDHTGSTSSTKDASKASEIDAARTLDLTKSDTSALTSHITSKLSRTHALVELRKLEEDSATAATKNTASAAPLIHNLKAYPTLGTQADLRNLVTYPPTLQPVPLKPLFLDVAWNYVDYPGRQNVGKKESKSEKMEVDAVEEKKEPEKKKGWFGFGR
ncbi:signal recognition particle subunit srp68 [Oleoguttula sp. CCFEE 5521]